MTEINEDEVTPVRLIIRVHLPIVSPYDVAELQERIRSALSEYPDVEIETAMMGMLRTT